MVCPNCCRVEHYSFECLYPHSCTCQHRMGGTRTSLSGKESEPSPGSFIAQENTQNAADRLEA
jgi:hypothetical protein